MEPAEASVLAEKSLRHLIRSEMGEAWKASRGAPNQQDLLNRRAGEKRARTGVELSNDDLDYLYIKELQAIYRANWRKFEAVFPKRIQFETLLELLVQYRNTPAHGRDLLPFERDLVAGAAGYIDVHVARYRSEKDDAGSYYPNILSVVDNFGTKLTPDGYKPRPVNSYSVLEMHFGRRLDVGQTVTFTAEGSDSRQRDLQWTLRQGHPHSTVGRDLDFQVGNPATLTWTVSHEDVGEGMPIVVRLTTASRYKRISYTPDNQYDDEHTIRYSVRPPLHEETPGC